MFKSRLWVAAAALTSAQAIFNLAVLWRAHLPDQHEMQGFLFSKAVPSEILEGTSARRTAHGNDIQSRVDMTRAVNRRLFQASAAAALAVIIIALGYLGTRGQPPAQNSPVEKLSIALPVLPHYALVHVAAAKGYFAEEGLDVSIQPVNYGRTAIRDVVQGKADLAIAGEVPFVIAVMKGDALGVV